jgi:hypothetical protein
VTEPLKWYDENEGHSPWIKALAEVRHRATREGWCYHHVQAIIVAIDQYAESALGNREFFLNRPHGIGGGRNKHIPGARDRAAPVGQKCRCAEKRIS